MHGTHQHCRSYPFLGPDPPIPVPHLFPFSLCPSPTPLLLDADLSSASAGSCTSTSGMALAFPPVPIEYCCSMLYSTSALMQCSLCLLPGADPKQWACTQKGSDRQRSRSLTWKQGREGSQCPPGNRLCCCGQAPRHPAAPPCSCQNPCGGLPRLGEPSWRMVRPPAHCAGTWRSLGRPETPARALARVRVRARPGRGGPELGSS